VLFLMPLNCVNLFCNLSKCILLFFSYISSLLPLFLWLKQLFLLYLDIVLNWPEDGRLRPKHVAKYNLLVIIASCLDLCCVLTVQSILYKYRTLSTCPYETMKYLKVACGQ
jgi:hypothetical protein